jgi:hypothetical protein
MANKLITFDELVQTTLAAIYPRRSYNMNHMEFAKAESEGLKQTPFEAWIGRVEKIVGHDLDGDLHQDGYSMDDCYDLFEQGLTARECAVIVMTATADRRAKQ